MISDPAQNVVAWPFLRMAGRKTPTLNILIEGSGFFQPPEIQPASQTRLDYDIFFQQVYFLWTKPGLACSFPRFLTKTQNVVCWPLLGKAGRKTPTLNSSIEGSGFCQASEIQPASQPRLDYL